MGGVKEDVLAYLSAREKENKYRIASALKIDEGEVIEALDSLQDEGKIEINGCKAMLIKEKLKIRQESEEKGEGISQHKAAEELEKWVKSSLINIKEAIEKSLQER